jgi:hypothetical protein
MDNEDVVDARTIDDDVRLNGGQKSHSGGFVDLDGVCKNLSSSAIMMGGERGVGMRRGKRRRRSSTISKTTVTTTTSFNAHHDDELARREAERGVRGLGGKELGERGRSNCIKDVNNNNNIYFKIEHFYLSKVS